VRDVPKQPSLAVLVSRPTILVTTSRARKYAESSNLNVGWRAFGHGLVEQDVEVGDVVLGDGLRIWTKETCRKRCLCNGKLMGCHDDDACSPSME
jgi:hypothetical protein